MVCHMVSGENQVRQNFEKHIKMIDITDFGRGTAQYSRIAAIKLCTLGLTIKRLIKGRIVVIANFPEILTKKIAFWKTVRSG